MKRPGTLRRIWTMPVLLAVLTVFGLLAALLGEGLWQPLAWLALAAPVIVMLRHLIKPQDANRPRRL